MPDGESAGAPVQVIKLNSGYLAGSQPHIQQAASHSKITLAICAVLIKSAEKSDNFFVCQMLRHGIQGPTGDTGNGGQQRLDLVAADHCTETQVAPQCTAEDAE